LEEQSVLWKLWKLVLTERRRVGDRAVSPGTAESAQKMYAKSGRAAEEPKTEPKGRRRAAGLDTRQRSTHWVLGWLSETVGVAGQRGRNSNSTEECRWSPAVADALLGWAEPRSEEEGV
jgi:hypothetical protein